MRKRYVFGAGLIAIGAALAAALGQGQAPIVISASVALTGGGASLGVGEGRTIEMLVKRINAAGGVGGRPLRVNVYDDNSDPQRSVLNVRKGIIEDRAIGVICCTTTPTSQAAIDTATRSRVPMVSMAASASLVEPVNQKLFIFKTPPADRTMVRATMNEMRRRGVKRLAFLGFADSYGEGGLVETNKYLATAGITLVATERFNRTDTDTTAQAARIVAARPDAVLVWAIPPGAVTAHKGLLAAGFRGQIYQSYGVTNADFLRLGGRDVEGVIIAALPIVVYDQLPATAANRDLIAEFVRAYRAEYNNETPNSFAGHAYDAVTLFVEAARRALAAGKDPANLEDFRSAVRDQLEGLRGVKGISGTFNMSKADHTGLGPSSANIITVQNGAFRLIGAGR